MVSSWLNFGGPAPREGGLRRGENFWLRFTTGSAQCLRLSERSFFHGLWLDGRNWRILLLLKFSKIVNLGLVKITAWLYRAQGAALQNWKGPTDFNRRHRIFTVTTTLKLHYNSSAPQFWRFCIYAYILAV